MGEWCAGFVSLIGERGRVRELWDLGERMLLGFADRDAARDAAVVVFARFGFLGLVRELGWGAGSFSLSDRMAISELRLLVPLVGDARAGLECLAAEDGMS